MNPDELIRYMAALLASIEQAERNSGTRGPFPASIIYLAFGSDLGLYNKVVTIASRVGWVTITPSSVALTEEGREKGRKVNEMLTNSG